MPRMVTIDINPDLKKSKLNAEEKETLDAIERRGPLRVDYVTAVENIQRSKAKDGTPFYAILSEEPSTVHTIAPAVEPLEKRSLHELKEMMIGLGIKSDKQMTRTEAVSVIQKKMDEFDIVEDGEAAGA